MGNGAEYIDVVPLSSSGTWGNGVIHPLGNAGIGTTDDIVTADLNGSGKPSIRPDRRHRQHLRAPHRPPRTTRRRRTDPNDNTATAHYNSFGQLTSETLFDGTSTTSIDSAAFQRPAGPGRQRRVVNRLRGSVTDPDGRTTTLTLNWMSHPTGELEANGGTASTTYNSLGFPTSETERDGSHCNLYI